MYDVMPSGTLGSCEVMPRGAPTMYDVKFGGRQVSVMWCRVGQHTGE